MFGYTAGGLWVLAFLSVLGGKLWRVEPQGAHGRVLLVAAKVLFFALFFVLTAGVAYSASLVTALRFHDSDIGFGPALLVVVDVPLALLIGGFVGYGAARRKKMLLRHLVFAFTSITCAAVLGPLLLALL
ncbi:MAG: hypothetical protein ABI609_13580 [Acidobacteriota bacterium]